MAFDIYINGGYFIVKVAGDELIRNPRAETEYKRPTTTDFKFTLKEPVLTGVQSSSTYVLGNESSPFAYGDLSGVYEDNVAITKPASADALALYLDSKIGFFFNPDPVEITSSSSGMLTKDFLIEVEKGNIPGHTLVHKFGSIVNALVGVTADVWDGGGTYPFPATTADMTHISQTTDQIAARGSTWVIEGANTSYAEVTQTVLLDGTDSTTPVALATPLFRVDRMYMILPDITLTSTVRLHNAAETIDYTDIQTDHNQTLNAIYTVKAAHTGFLLNVNSDYVPTAIKNPDGVHFHLQIRRNLNLEPWRVVESFGVTPGASIYKRAFSGGIMIEEKSDIKVSIKPEGKDCHGHASFDILIIDNSYL